jgi:hypothetical protein
MATTSGKTGLFAFDPARCDAMSGHCRRSVDTADRTGPRAIALDCQSRDKAYRASEADRRASRCACCSLRREGLLPSGLARRAPRPRPAA